MIDHAEPYPEMPDNLPPLPPKWSAPLSLPCVCPTVSGGPMVVPECPIHAGPFGREAVKLRAEVVGLRVELEAATAERDDALGQLDDAQCRIADLEAGGTA